jgi:hypothetical protein
LQQAQFKNYFAALEEAAALPAALPAAEPAPLPATEPDKLPEPAILEESPSLHREPEPTLVLPDATGVEFAVGAGVAVAFGEEELQQPVRLRISARDKMQIAKIFFMFFISPFLCYVKEKKRGYVFCIFA